MNSKKPIDVVDLRRASTRLAAARLNEPLDHDALPMQILTRAVVNLVDDPQATPRPGQARLTEDVTATLRGNPGAEPGVDGGQLVAAAPTGVGKSFAVLSPAAAAALQGQRTVISTESLNLQTQLMDKDGPAVLDACQQETTVRPTMAVFKGWSNYACLKSAVDASWEAAGREAGHHGGTGSLRRAREVLAEVTSRRGVVDSSATADKTSSAPTPGEVNLIDWVLQQGLSEGTGDINTYPGKLPPGGWAKVSVSSSDCVGADCPLFELCLPRMARDDVAAADIVVTNHTMLGIQAAKAVPVVTGSRKLGTFHHLVVDECHALPGTVRAQGASEVGGKRISHLVTNITRTLSGLEGTKGFDLLLREGNELGEMVTTAVAEAMPASTRQAARLGVDDEPLNELAGPLHAWLLRCGRLVGDNLAAQPPQSRQVLALKRLTSRIDSLHDAVGAVSQHEIGVARWAEQDPAAGAVLRSSPVDVAPVLAGGLWQARVVDPRDDEDQHEPSQDDESSDETVSRPAQTYRLNVVCLSATVPAGFGAQIGLRAPITTYESPFEDAYADATALYVPRLATDDVERLSKPGTRGRRRFDTYVHPEWARDQMAALVHANQGSALVLAATTRAGQQYAAHLKEHSRGRWRVLSQWDGPPPRRIVADWRDDVQSVLVGTRSLMTGVDAPGRTCSLVVVDRVPRAAGNVVDDARVEALSERLDIDRWAADRLVYYADARTLLEQASGRLIRSVTDGGMCAVLDPRLLKSSKVAYPEKTRDFMMRPMRHFGTKLSSLATAEEWITTSHAGVLTSTQGAA